MKKIIYDFGANNGDDLQYYLLKSDLVIAVEANPLLCKQINIRFANEIRSGKLVVKNCILTAAHTSVNVPFYIHKTNHVLSQFPCPEESLLVNFEQIELPAINVIEIIKKWGEPFYIKIDLEHYDHVILKELLLNNIHPPYLSAESHSIDIFCILVALGDYEAFKLVDGATVSEIYANHKILVGNNLITYSFPYHSAGPFGNDIKGDWITKDCFSQLLAQVGLGWKDIHASKNDKATKEFTPSPPFQIQLARDDLSQQHSAETRVLYATHSSQAYIPPLSLSERQIIVGPSYKDTYDELGRTLTLNCPREFDVAELISRLPESERPDLFVALVDSHFGCVPRNLSEVNCRKVLIIADTHHGPAPLFHLIVYSKSEPYDRIAVTHDPHHLHWFAQTAQRPVALHLNLNVHDTLFDFETIRRRHILFIGSTGPHHLRRNALLNSLKQAELPIAIGTGTADAAAGEFAQAQITFNCSLNGDLNMRVFEVLVAGGCLLTDRLGAATGLERLFVDGRDLILYDDSPDLLAKASHYLANPALCLQIAAQGQQRYRDIAAEPLRRQRFLDFALAEAAAAQTMAQQAQSIDPRCQRRDPPLVFEQRLGVYQILQELQRQQVINQVELSPKLVSVFADDLADLVQLRILPKAQNGASACAIINARDLVDRLGQSALAPLRYLLVVNAKGDLFERYRVLKRLTYRATVNAKIGDTDIWLLQAMR
jgi:hypothetical protein